MYEITIQYTDSWRCNTAFGCSYPILPKENGQFTCVTFIQRTNNTSSFVDAMTNACTNTCIHTRTRIQRETDRERERERERESAIYVVAWHINNTLPLYPHVDENDSLRLKRGISKLVCHLVLDSEWEQYYVHLTVAYGHLMSLIGTYSCLYPCFRRIPSKLSSNLKMTRLSIK